MYRLTEKELGVQLSVALRIALSDHIGALRANNATLRAMTEDAILLKFVAAVSNSGSCVVRTDLVGMHASTCAGKFEVDEPWPAKLTAEIRGLDEASRDQLLLFVED